MVREEAGRRTTTTGATTMIGSLLSFTQYLNKYAAAGGEAEALSPALARGTSTSIREKAAAANEAAAAA